MLLGCKAVISLRVSLFWSRLHITSTAFWMGTFLKREDTSKLTKSSSGFSFTPAMTSTKCLEFLTNESPKPVNGEIIWTMCLESLYEGNLMHQTMGLSGTSS